MDKFLEAAEAAAESIEKGELGPSEGDSYDPIEGRQWVHKSSWKYLAEINRRGLITVNSQDAKDPVDGIPKPWERSYVNGVMEKGRAEEFVSKINIFAPDKIAMIDIVVPDKSPEWTDRGLRIGTNVYWSSRLGRWDTRGGRGYDIKVHMPDPGRQWYGVPDDLQLVKVEVIDSKWGRSAVSKKGLYKAILRALDPSMVYTREDYPEWHSGSGRGY